MEIAASQTDERTLVALSAQAASLLTSGQIEELARQFGYALAYGREISAAIEEDLQRCLNELGADSLAPGDPPPATVSYFAPQQDLVAAMECWLPATPKGEVLLELVVTAGGSKRHVTLEQISAVA